MNYMKILLLYMAATLSLSVQSTSAPVETPVPTPTAYVEEIGTTPAPPGPRRRSPPRPPRLPAPA